MIFFLLQLVNMVLKWIDIEESLHPWDNSHLIMANDPFNIWMDSICLYLVGGYLHPCLSVILICDSLLL